MVSELEELPAPPEVVYPAVLRAIRELMLQSQPRNAWLDTVEGDLAGFEENRQVTPTLFYTNMGTLPDDGIRADPEQQVWVDASMDTLIWLGQVSGNRIGPPRPYGMPLWPAFGSAAACPNCKREYMAEGWVSWMAAHAWAHKAIPRLLIEVGPEATARRILGAAGDSDATAVLDQARALLKAAGVEVTARNLIKWPRATCPACGAMLATRTWRLEGSPMRLVAGEPDI